MQMHPVVIRQFVYLFGLLSVSCMQLTKPDLDRRTADGAKTVLSGKVSGRAYSVAGGTIKVYFTNPWTSNSRCKSNSTLAESVLCDVDANTSAAKTDKNADVRAANRAIVRLIKQSAQDVATGLLPQHSQLDVVQQDLDNKLIIDALEDAIANGVHVRFVGNRNNNSYEGSTADEEADSDQYYSVDSGAYTNSQSGFEEIAKALDDAYPVTHYDGATLLSYLREKFPVDEAAPKDGSTANASGVQHIGFFSGKTAKNDTTSGVSDFNLVNNIGQMHHKFFLIKTRALDPVTALPLTGSNGYPMINYHVITGSTNATDNGYYRNNNNVIIFTETRESVVGVEGLVLSGLTNTCPASESATKPCLFNTYKRQMNYLLTDYRTSFKPANPALANYTFANDVSINLYFSDFQSTEIIPNITNAALSAKEAIYFMAFSFSTATATNGQGIQLHQAISDFHPNRGTLDVRGLVSPGRSENYTTMTAIRNYVDVEEYDNGAEDPDFLQGGGRLHHKVMVIDPCSSSGKLITGSANWSKTVDGLNSGSPYEHKYLVDGADSTTDVIYTVNKGAYNNEDLLIIESNELAKLYYEKEFLYLTSKANLWQGDLQLCG